MTRCPRCHGEVSPGPILACVPCGYSWRPLIRQSDTARFERQERQRSESLRLMRDK